jgi:hypothetical protein
VSLIGILSAYTDHVVADMDGEDERDGAGHRDAGTTANALVDTEEEDGWASSPVRFSLLTAV